jgi:hypothetical protein
MSRSLIVAAALAFAALELPLVAAPEQEQQPVSGAAPPSTQADSGRADAPTPDRSSLWLLVPLVSSSPKLGTSFGALGAYVHTFDPASRVSMFGVNYPTCGGGLEFVLKPAQHLLMNLEYAQGVEDNRGIYLKFGYGW